MTKNNIKDKFKVSIYLRDVFGFAEWQEKGTLGLGYKLTLTRNTDSAVLNKDNAVNNAKIKTNSISWYIPGYTPSIQQQTMLYKQIKDKTPMELQYEQRSVFMKEVNTQKYRSFELGTQKGIKIPIWIIVGFQQRDRQDSQNLNNDTFYRPPVSSCQCIIVTERYSDNSILLNYDDYDCSQGYEQIKNAFRVLTKDDVLRPYISDNDFRSSIDGNDIGYNLYVFDIRYQKNFESAQPVKVEFKFSQNIDAGIYGYPLVLTNKLISISSDGQWMYHLV